VALQIIEETLPALQELKKEGLVRNIGFSGLPLAIYPAILDRHLPPLPFPPFPRSEVMVLCMNMSQNCYWYRPSFWWTFHEEDILNDLPPSPSYEYLVSSTRGANIMGDKSKSDDRKGKPAIAPNKAFEPSELGIFVWVVFSLVWELI
jgi:hypothetical protein